MNKPKLPSKVKKPLPSSAKKVKHFEIKQCAKGKRGEKVIIYAPPGMGKSTLALLAPTPVFLPIDGGVYELDHPLTGERPQTVEGITDFADVLAVLQNINQFKDFETVVIDNVTDLEHWGIPYVLDTVPNQKGIKVTNIEKYGWKEGYGHLWDAMRKIKTAAENLAAAGKNVIFTAHLSQIKVPNPGGEDFLCDAPDLYSGYPRSIVTLMAGWAGHIFKIDYDWIKVEDKKAAGSTERVIRVHPEVYYMAKSRTISIEHKDVPFADITDDSIWQLIFNER